MNILSIDTATNVATAAIMNEEKLICEMIIDHDLNHSRTLLPLLNRMLEEAGMAYQDIDLYAAAVGPGSFTGLRIGLATVKGLCQATGKDLVPVSTLEALAYNIPYSKGLICPMLDARRHQVYTALFESDGKGNITRIENDMAKDIDELKDWIYGKRKPTYLLGEGALLFGKTLESENIQIVKPYLCKNKASSVAAYALSHPEFKEDFHKVEPIYLRPSYAEEKKK